MTPDMSSMDWRGRIAVLEAEREVLRAEVERLGAIGRAWNQPTRESEWQQMKAEVERLRKRISDEWLSLTAALGDHAHPGLSPSENVVELHERLTEARWEVKGLEAERDALRAEVGERRAENARLTSFPRSGHEAQAKLEKAEAALRKLTVDAALQGRVFKGNEGLPGAEEFYRAYNAGIKAQFEYARNIARAALRDTAPEVKP